LKPVWARRWLLTIIPFSFQNLYASQPNQGSIAGAQFSKKKAATKIILQADFSLSEKFRNGLAFNTTRYSLRDLLQQRKQFRLGLYLWEVWSPRAGPIDLLKTRRFMRPLVKGFRHQQFRNTPDN
jgi:iron complex outermembrane receptor protein